MLTMEEASMSTTATRYVYRFGGGVDDGGKGNKNLLGGKGANLDGMAAIGLPVPPGFTITTEMCTRYYTDGGVYPESLKAQVANGIAHIEGITGKKFGDKADPLLVSVRSGARISMPGMMDTVLNLGLNDETVLGLAAASGDERFAWDSYRRFIQMYSDVVLELDHGAFEEALEIAKEDQGYTLDTEMTAADWKALVAEYKALVSKLWSKPFPQDVNDQLWPTGPRSIAGSTRSRMIGAPPSTCRQWCSAIWATHRPPASPSPATPRPARMPIMANI